MYLNKFPCDNISDLDTPAISNIRVIYSAYSLPPKLGTTLLLKLWKTSIDIFNQNILNYYDDTDEIETECYLKEPCLM